MADSDVIKCVICSGNASPRIVKDDAYGIMFGVLWEALLLDIKFTENAKFDLCVDCFKKVSTFNNFNDTCFILERHITELTDELVFLNLNGIKKLKDTQKPLLDPHIQLEQAYPNGVPENAAKKGYKYQIEIEKRDNRQSGSSSREEQTQIIFDGESEEKEKEVTKVVAPQPKPAYQYQPRRGRQKKYYHTDEEDDDPLSS